MKARMNRKENSKYYLKEGLKQLTLPLVLVKSFICTLTKYY